MERSVGPVGVLLLPAVEPNPDAPFGQYGLVGFFAVCERCHRWFGAHRPLRTFVPPDVSAVQAEARTFLRAEGFRVTESDVRCPPCQPRLDAGVAAEWCVTHDGIRAWPRWPEQAKEG